MRMQFYMRLQFRNVKFEYDTWLWGDLTNKLIVYIKSLVTNKVIIYYVAN